MDYDLLIDYPNNIDQHFDSSSESGYGESISTNVENEVHEVDLPDGPYNPVGEKSTPEKAKKPVDGAGCSEIEAPTERFKSSLYDMMEFPGDDIIHFRIHLGDLEIKPPLDFSRSLYISSFMLKHAKEPLIKGTYDTNRDITYTQFNDYVNCGEPDEQELRKEELERWMQDNVKIHYHQIIVSDAMKPCRYLFSGTDREITEFMKSSKPQENRWFDGYFHITKRQVANYIRDKDIMTQNQKAQDLKNWMFRNLTQYIDKSEGQPYPERLDQFVRFKISKFLINKDEDKLKNGFYNADEYAWGDYEQKDGPENKTRNWLNLQKWSQENFRQLLAHDKNEQELSDIKWQKDWEMNTKDYYEPKEKQLTLKFLDKNVPFITHNQFEEYFKRDKRHEGEIRSEDTLKRWLNDDPEDLLVSQKQLYDMNNPCILNVLIWRKANYVNHNPSTSQETSEVDGNSSSRKSIEPEKSKNSKKITYFEYESFFNRDKKNEKLSLNELSTEFNLMEEFYENPVNFDDRMKLREIHGDSTRSRVSKWLKGLKIMQIDSMEGFDQMELSLQKSLNRKIPVAHYKAYFDREKSSRLNETYAKFEKHLKTWLENDEDDFLSKQKEIHNIDNPVSRDLINWLDEQHVIFWENLHQPNRPKKQLSIYFQDYQPYFAVCEEMDTLKDQIDSLENLLNDFPFVYTKHVMLENKIEELKIKLFKLQSGEKRTLPPIICDLCKSRCTCPCIKNRQVYDAFFDRKRTESDKQNEGFEKSLKTCLDLYGLDEFEKRVNLNTHHPLVIKILEFGNMRHEITRAEAEELERKKLEDTRERLELEMRSAQIIDMIARQESYDETDLYDYESNSSSPTIERNVEENIVSHIRNPPLTDITNTYNISGMSFEYTNDQPRTPLQEVLETLNAQINKLSLSQKQNLFQQPIQEKESEPESQSEPESDDEMTKEYFRNFDKAIMEGPYGLKQYEPCKARIKIVNDYLTYEVGKFDLTPKPWNRLDFFYIETDYHDEFWNDEHFYAEALKISAERAMENFPCNVLSSHNISFILKCVNGAYRNFIGADDDITIMTWDEMRMKNANREKPNANFPNWDKFHNQPHYLINLNWHLAYISPVNKNMTPLSTPENLIIHQLNLLHEANKDIQLSNTKRKALKNVVWEYFEKYRNQLTSENERKIKSIDKIYQKGNDNFYEWNDRNAVDPTKDNSNQFSNENKFLKNPNLKTNDSFSISAEQKVQPQAKKQKIEPKKQAKKKVKLSAEQKKKQPSTQSTVNQVKQQKQTKPFNSFNKRFGFSSSKVTSHNQPRQEDLPFKKRITKDLQRTSAKKTETKASNQAQKGNQNSSINKNQVKSNPRTEKKSAQKNKSNQQNQKSQEQMKPKTDQKVIGYTFDGLEILADVPVEKHRRDFLKEDVTTKIKIGKFDLEGSYSLFYAYDEDIQARDEVIKARNIKNKQKFEIRERPRSTSCGSRNNKNYKRSPSPRVRKPLYQRGDRSYRNSSPVPSKSYSSHSSKTQDSRRDYTTDYSSDSDYYSRSHSTNRSAFKRSRTPPRRSNSNTRRDSPIRKRSSNSVSQSSQARRTNHPHNDSYDERRNQSPTERPKGRSFSDRFRGRLGPRTQTRQRRRQGNRQSTANKNQTNNTFNRFENNRRTKKFTSNH